MKTIRRVAFPLCLFVFICSVGFSQPIPAPPYSDHHAAVALHEILENQNFSLDEVNEAIRRGAIIDHIGYRSGKTPLIKGIRMGRWDFVKAILEAGADVNKPCRFSKTPLMHSVVYYDDINLWNLLIEHGATAHQLGFGNQKQSALSFAVKTAKTIEHFKVLVEAGGCHNWRAPGHRGENLLMLFVANNLNLDIVEYLIELGVDVHYKDGNGTNALGYAARANPNVEIIQLVIDQNVDINNQDTWGISPLMHAAKTNPNPLAVKALLDAGADPSLTNDRGLTAYDLSKANSHFVGTPVYKELKTASGR